MRRLFSNLLGGMALCLAVQAGAADFPSQGVRIVVPFAPGGGTDVVARALAERLMVALGVQVMVDNKPGGNSVIATRAAASAPPTGTHSC